MDASLIGNPSRLPTCDWASAVVIRQADLKANCRPVQLVFQAPVITRLSYASSTWWGFASAGDKARLEVFVSHSVRLRYRAASSPTLKLIYAEADKRLFNRINSNSRHLLHALRPPTQDNHYELRAHRLYFTLLSRFPTTLDCNLINRLLW